jgi:transcriptional regulator of acetoin/glycerol metabolism
VANAAGGANVNVADARVHEDFIRRVLDGEALEDAIDVSSSWRRSALDYRVQPDDRDAPQILTTRETEILAEPLQEVVFTGREEIDRLHTIVGQVGYVVLLCNTDGIAIHHRGNEALADQFKHWGLWLGGVWSEVIEGTNGIGTAIIERRPVSVHRVEHFRTRHIGLSCAGAPICDPDGNLIGVLDSSSIDPMVSEHTHGLALATTLTAAREIEERLFREKFRRCWIVVARPQHEIVAPVLLAVDGHHRIVGANHYGRLLLGLTEQHFDRGATLTDFFDPAVPPLKRLTADIAAPLRRHGVTWIALFTPPATGTAARSSLYTRPRQALLDGWSPSPTRARGGLGPAVLRRIEQFVDSRLDQKMPVEIMADVAGLSVHHFARMFRHSTGESPHAYIVRRRIERAQRLIRGTDRPLASIATEVGFADHSHLSKHFRRLTGETPAVARRTSQSGRVHKVR